jgi:hypothetical protein
MAYLEAPHWLMIGGALLVIVGFLGLALSRNNEAAVVSASPPDDHAQKNPPPISSGS